MRRKDREVASMEAQMEILRECKVCRLAMVDDGRPYVVPVNFGAELEGGRPVLYIHGAKEGRKSEVLSRAPEVCVEVDCECALIEADTPCGYGCSFASVIGEGKAELLKAPAEKIHGLEVLMKHQTGRDFTFTSEQADAVAVYRIRLDSCTGKRRA